MPLVMSMRWLLQDSWEAGGLGLSDPTLTFQGRGAES